MNTQEILNKTKNKFVLLKVLHKNSNTFKWVVMERINDSIAVVGGIFSSEYETIASIVEYKELPNI